MTIVDVAAEAGVSVATVSRVLRDHADVKAETREHVQRAIDRLGYRPSPVARALVSGETKLLALLVSDISNPFYPQLAKSVEQEAKREDYSVIICSTDDRVAETRRQMERLLQQGLDGIIHASVARDEDLVLRLVPDPRRIVFTNRRPESEAISYVVSNNREGAKNLTRHLLEQGHRRLGFISGPEWASNAADRLTGFWEALSEVRGAEARVASGPFSGERVSEVVGGWMSGKAAPTAIIAVNDSIALGAFAALAERGLSVPEDVALAGFDGVRFAAMPMLDLTTVDQQISELGRRSTRLLLRQLQSPGTFVPKHEVLPTRLLVGRTSAALVEGRKDVPKGDTKKGKQVPMGARAGRSDDRAVDGMPVL